VQDRATRNQLVEGQEVEFVGLDDATHLDGGRSVITNIVSNPVDDHAVLRRNDDPVHRCLCFPDDLSGWFLPGFWTDTLSPHLVKL